MDVTNSIVPSTACQGARSLLLHACASYTPWISYTI